MYEPLTLQEIIEILSEIKVEYPEYKEIVMLSSAGDEVYGISVFYNVKEDGEIDGVSISLDNMEEIIETMMGRLNEYYGLIKTYNSKGKFKGFSN